MDKFKVTLHLARHKGTTKHPIYLRIYANGKTTYKSTGYEVEPKYWNDTEKKLLSSHRVAGHINAALELMKSEATKKLIEVQISGKKIASNIFKQKEFSSDLFQFVVLHKKDVGYKFAANTLKNYNVVTAKIKEYINAESLGFDEIDLNWLIDFERYLGNECKATTIHNIFKTLKAFFNAAIKRGVTNNYPFKNFDMPKYKPPKKDYLTKDELNLFYKHFAGISNMIMREAIIYYLLGCYTGLRVSDWYSFNLANNVQDGELVLTTKKTKTEVKIGIHNKLQQILDWIGGGSLKIAEQTINECLKVYAKQIGIKKHLTTHTARHTFAITVCLWNGLSSESSAKLMGITLNTFIKDYSQITQAKIKAETVAAWANL